MKKSTRLIPATFAAIALALGVAVALPAAHAQAATLNGCTLSATIPVDDNTNVWSTASLSCSTSKALNVRAALDEKVGPIWDNVEQGWSAWEAKQGTSVSKKRTVGCNGHGTDVWRGRAGGIVNGTSGETTSSTTSITC
ncbi:MAG: hypothetical protein LBD77_01815 [Bifidobacteriaceae bacterium]|jgi:hypothetical protein|nr:hypothetical protein [Bifidobacteriaceae bacterium]